jgi:phosphatidylserine decarboxylase
VTIRSALAALALQEDLNFLLTNRIPRRLATRLVGRISRVEQPLVRDLSMSIWRLFTDLDLSDAMETEFRSLHACFTRRLKDGARPIDRDPAVLTSPCDAIVGASGRVEGTTVYQAKGFPYTLQDLLGSAELEGLHANGLYVTLRITSAMYHRFHAPHDCRVESVIRISGDTWNVNPIALKRIERLFCRNERAVIPTRLEATGQAVTLVAIAAILVPGIRLRFLDEQHSTPAPDGNVIACDATLSKGQEMGWFEHGSTIVIFAPGGFSLSPGVREGCTVRMGEALLRLA